MKNVISRLANRILVPLAILAAVPVASAQTNLWTGGSGTDLLWTTPGNWDPAGPPESTNQVYFLDAGATNDAGINNIVDTDITVAAAIIAPVTGLPANPVVHNTLINPGVTLTVSDTNTTGEAYRVGTEDYVVVTTTVTNSVAGHALAINNPENILTVRQGHGSAGAHHATLDLTGLDTFSTDLQEIRVGVGNADYRRAVGTLRLARTNILTVRGTEANPGILVGDNSGNNNNNSSISFLWLGGDNTINVDYIRVGGQKQQGQMLFDADTFPSPTLLMRGSDGIGRVTEIAIGDGHEQSGSGNPTTGRWVLGDGTVDILAGTVYVGRSQTGTGREGVGFLTMGAGMMDVNVLEIGYEDTGNSSQNFSAAGTVTLNGTTLRVNETLRMGRDEGATAPQNATLEVTGGTVLAREIVVGSATANAVVTVDGGSLFATNGMGSSSTPVDALSLTNATLLLPARTIAASATAGELALGAGNALNIRSVSALGAYPAQIPVIKYTNLLGGFNLTLGSLPAAFPDYEGYLTNNTANGSIDLVLTNGPISRTLTWDGLVNGDWDLLNAANWRTNGGPTTFFNNGDLTVFDDSLSGETNINITTAVAPGSLTISNETTTYSFGGVGEITGDVGLLKRGAGTLILSGTTPHEYTGGTVIEGGTLQVGDGGGTGSLPAGTSVDNAGVLIVNRTDDVTISGPISGAGSIIKTNVGALTLSGDNNFSGALEVREGTLRAGSGSALGTTDTATTISSGATLDVNGQSLGIEPVIASGAGVSGAGAIVNTGGDSLNALRDVTLTDHTTIGGTGRWDIRSAGGVGQLSTGGNAYNLTKVGLNQVSLVGISVDFAIANVTVQEGVLSIETTTTGLGNLFDTLTVSNGATFRMFNLTAPLNKIVDLHGDGVATTLHIDSGTANAFSGSVTLNGASIFDLDGGTMVTFNGSISGTSSLAVIGDGAVTMNGPVGYTGALDITDATVQINGARTGGTGITVNGGTLSGTLGFSPLNESLSITNGTLAPGSDAQASLDVEVNGNVVLDNSTAVFSLDTVGAGQNDRVIVDGDLTLAGTNVLRIAPETFLKSGEIFTLFSCTGTLTADTNNLVLEIPSGYTISFVDPPDANTIQIQIDHAIKNLIWVGSAGPDWDVDSTVNWDSDVNQTADSVFTNLDIVNFDNDGDVTNVNLVGTLEPSQINFTNFSQDYMFSGSGKITGSGGLRMQGPMAVTIANTGGNDFTGPVVVNQGTLYLGDGVTAGTAGSGSLIMTNPLAFPPTGLVFNHTGTLDVENTISGNVGGITNLGSGITRLNGASTFGMDVHVLNGTLAAGNGSALGQGETNGVTIVTNSASLDINGQNLGSEVIVASGGGVGGQGVIVNNSTNAQTQALRFVTLAGDVTIGGANRWDIRGAPAALLTTPTNSPYNITKVGTNQISLVGITTVDSALGDIDIQEGFLGIETTTAHAGDPAKTITIHGGATLGFWALGALLDKVVDVQDGGIIRNGSGVSAMVGPISMDGTVTFDVAGTALVLSNNVLSTVGPSLAGFVKTSTGTLTLVGNSVPTSTVYDIAAGTLDLSEASSSTLTVGSGETLKGSGTILGSVVVATGGALEPGASVGTLTVTNAVSLAAVSETTMELDAGAVTSDRISGAAIISYGGVLTITNINGTLAGGQSYQLFSADAYAGGFATVNLPPLPAYLEWVDNLDVDGTIAIISLAPGIVQAQKDGNDIVISGTNGIPDGTYYVLVSTNIAEPLANWTILSTNLFESDGTFSITNAIDLTLPELYFDLLLQVP